MYLALVPPARGEGGGGGAVRFRSIQSVGCPLSAVRPHCRRYYDQSHGTNRKQCLDFFFLCAFNIGPAAAVPAVPVPLPLTYM